MSALLDGAPVSPDAALPLESHGVLLGDSAFETMRAYSGKPFALEAHLDRLVRAAAWARLRLGATRETIARECAEVAASFGREDSAVRVFVMRGARTSDDVSLGARPTRRLVFAEPLHIDASLYVRGALACTLPAASFATQESPHAKYARYLPRLLARDEAKARGCNEALLVDVEGRIVEAATASVFVFAGGRLVSASVLESITRNVVVDLAREQGISCEARPIERVDLEAASEMFVASSLRELVPVVRVDEQNIGEGSPGALTRSLHAGLRARACATGPQPWEAT